MKFPKQQTKTLSLKGQSWDTYMYYTILTKCQDQKKQKMQNKKITFIWRRQFQMSLFTHFWNKEQSNTAVVKNKNLCLENSSLTKNENLLYPRRVQM